MHPAVGFPRTNFCYDALDHHADVPWMPRPHHGSRLQSPEDHGQLRNRGSSLGRQSGAACFALRLADRGLGATSSASRLLAGLWSLRLTWHLSTRHFREPEDGRYATLREQWGEKFDSTLFWFYQGQAVADRRLSTWRSNPVKRGRTSRGGLWAYSQHPNYFLEWCGWLVYPLLRLGLPWGATLWFAPLVMLYLVLKVTGIPPTEEQSLRSRGDDYRNCQASINAFFQDLPKSQSATSRTSDENSSSTCRHGTRSKTSSTPWHPPHKGRRRTGVGTISLHQLAAGDGPQCHPVAGEHPVVHGPSHRNHTHSSACLPVPPRQAEGFLRSLLDLKAVSLEATDHTTLSRRAKGHKAKLLAIASKKPVHLIIDSTRLSIMGVGESAAAKPLKRG
ncbi:MAG: hypothetical protein ACI9F9_001869 [Candidatus Paceibacteria bacterium]|jgi:hypothetical protein